MVYRATKAIAEAFEAKGIKHEIQELSKTSAVKASFNAKNAPSITVRFISSDDDSDVSVRIFSFVKVPENKTDAMLVMLNDLNKRFRYVRFRLDSDNEVMVSYDMAVATADVGNIANEILLRIVKIADEAYPDLMKALWS